jgi:hypothetical protein
MSVSDSSTIGKDRYARLRDLSRDDLWDGLDVLGEQYLNGDVSVAPTFAAYLDETARRLAEK